MLELLLGRGYEFGNFGGGKWSDSEITANVTKNGKLSEPPIRTQMPAMSLVANLASIHGLSTSVSLHQHIPHRDDQTPLETSPTNLQSYVGGLLDNT